VHHLIAEDDGGRARHAELRQFRAAGGIGLDVDGIEPDPPRREELLRLGAG
jgi:hypothetical protein